MPEKVTTWLWFDTQAEEAAEFYVSVFDGGKVLDVTRYGEGGTESQCGWLKDRYGGPGRWSHPRWEG